MFLIYFRLSNFYFQCYCCYDILELKLPFMRGYISMPIFDLSKLTVVNFAQVNHSQLKRLDNINPMNHHN